VLAQVRCSHFKLFTKQFDSTPRMLKVEIDEHARRVIRCRQEEGHLAQCPLFGDIAEFHLSQCGDDIATSDGIMGGFPCQVIGLEFGGVCRFHSKNQTAHPSAFFGCLARE
jgi:hypothetical protein